MILLLDIFTEYNVFYDYVQVNFLTFHYTELRSKSYFIIAFKCYKSTTSILLGDRSAYVLYEY